MASAARRSRTQGHQKKHAPLLASRSTLLGLSEHRACRFAASAVMLKSKPLSCPVDINLHVSHVHPSSMGKSAQSVGRLSDLSSGLTFLSCGDVVFPVSCRCPMDMRQTYAVIARCNWTRLARNVRVLQKMCPAIGSSFIHHCILKTVVLTSAPSGHPANPKAFRCSRRGLEPMLHFDRNTHVDSLEKIVGC